MLAILDPDCACMFFCFFLPKWTKLTKLLQKFLVTIMVHHHLNEWINKQRLTFTLFDLLSSALFFSFWWQMAGEWGPSIVYLNKLTQNNHNTLNGDRKKWFKTCEIHFSWSGCLRLCRFWASSDFSTSVVMGIALVTLIQTEGFLLHSPLSVSLLASFFLWLSLIFTLSKISMIAPELNMCLGKREEGVFL